MSPYSQSKKICGALILAIIGAMPYSEAAVGIVTGLGNATTSNVGTGAAAISAFNDSLLGTETISDNGNGSNYGTTSITADASVPAGSSFNRTANATANTVLNTTGFSYQVRDKTLPIGSSGLSESDYSSSAAFVVEGLPNGVSQGDANDASNFGFDSDSTGSTHRGVAHFHFSDPIGHFGVNVLDFESPIPSDWDGVSVGIDMGDDGTIDTVVIETIIEGQIIVFRNGTLIGNRSISWTAPQGLGNSDINLGDGSIGFVGIGTAVPAEAFTDVYLVVGGATFATTSNSNPTYYNPSDLTGNVTATTNPLEGSQASSNRWAVSGMIFGPALSTIPEPSATFLLVTSLAFFGVAVRRRP